MHNIEYMEVYIMKSINIKAIELVNYDALQQHVGYIQDLCGLEENLARMCKRDCTVSFDGNGNKLVVKWDNRVAYPTLVGTIAQEYIIGADYDAWFAMRSQRWNVARRIAEMRVRAMVRRVNAQRWA